MRHADQCVRLIVGMDANTRLPPSYMGVTGDVTRSCTTNASSCPVPLNDFMLARAGPGSTHAGIDHESTTLPWEAWLTLAVSSALLTAALIS